ncbi:MAG TPA: pyridoxamine 5'-phosphate oxidase family protein [Candidatus Saccharimonadales bacterium]|nr:pyridoxamine 5'-phosphate oxidase family protein [Candidatus Saccharimonadales bacterium]
MNVEKVIRDYLPNVIHLSLATTKDNKPWVCEVHFAYDENLNLYYRSLTSRRHSREIAENPNVSGNIVKQHKLGEAGVGVYFEGVAELLKSGEAQQIAFECIKERLKADDEILEEAKLPDGHQFYKISVNTYYVFGAFEDKPSQKYELKWNGGSK